MARTLEPYNQKRDFRKTAEPKGRAGKKRAPAAPAAPEAPASRSGITLEKVRLTSSNKEMFAGTGITKEAVARYYLAVAPRLLPFIENRILHVLRCPGGAPGSCFFQRHLERKAAGIGTVQVRKKDGELDDFFYIENKSGLVSAVQMGALEFHAWGSRVERLEQPDILVFDLDPDVGLGLAQVRQGVQDLRSVLESLALTPFLKTSGGKGYHMVIPIEPAAEWPDVQAFTKQVAETLAERWPERYTSSTRKARRQGRIYVDWLRNTRSASSVVPWSLRARNGAPVSLPIAWSELETVAPADIGIQEALRRLENADPWADFFTVRQRLPD